MSTYLQNYNSKAVQFKFFLIVYKFKPELESFNYKSWSSTVCNIYLFELYFLLTTVALSNIIIPKVMRLQSSILLDVNQYTTKN